MCWNRIGFSYLIAMHIAGTMSRNKSTRPKQLIGQSIGNQSESKGR
ncbi:hypothetical protein BofuT4_uP055840.1 [Botrytis cinerea T4]|uniref:Uncharacterized protein n=1 Tax=Botryotinia fuckeliana (strain T4) TaxID=999810 RepID=G2XW13_BOTF4|nr:hypothetical protein BofuT4_uP055840.1 [Botrytis cinerea T4]